MKETKNPFKIIQGDNQDPVLSRDERKRRIAESLENLSRGLSAEEGLVLGEMMTKDELLDLKSSVLKYCGRILADQEAEFIQSQLLLLPLKGEKSENARRELTQAFPDLKEYFENQIKSYRQE